MRIRLFKMKRIIGLDVARALAIIGMIIVNFKVVFGGEGHSWLKSIANTFDGKAVATFVVLAGVGLALMARSGIPENDRTKLKLIRKRIAKRALFLFLVGLSYNFIWPADILHFYGVYMLVILLVLRVRNGLILGLGAVLIFVYPFLMLIFNYDLGWDFNTLTYHGFWTIKGFVRNLFYNGFHPVLPWSAFMLFGYWLGRKDLRDERFLKKLFGISLIAFLTIQLVSKVLIDVLSEGSPEVVDELFTIMGTSPMPPLPVYMCNGIAIAFTVISGCILLSNRFPNNKVIDALTKTGQLSLTFYVAHVVIGMGVIVSKEPEKLGLYPLEFSFVYALFFSLLCIVFAIIWRTFKKSGPLEYVMRKLTDGN